MMLDKFDKYTTLSQKWTTIATENLISERNNNNVSRDDIQWTLVNRNNIIVNNNDTQWT